ncbi:hypothetical protein LGL55_23005 [Clostridium tagluense]|uniref:hypothetical protein n=1 Tax=Clostridium tagluense TaxID=360422 RepID=UPI001C0C4B83|nr:hypothetical protein [Clostridium tagluense]MBU3130198.1 hypothetical protein [Clostridium tagluense]MCB2313656.1 hypothetical protein [Clostridium tagluense]MCB2318788.1 hypothetical protein [Clostridium tagluense]MCB2323638.1 hypothetical protein [Clostridium tagluense]MCB2328511.1 hypothetical protein [Clostridium tagluense]
MKNIKTFALAIAVVSALSSSMVFAAVTTKTPTDIIAGLTGKTVHAIYRKAKYVLKLFNCAYGMYLSSAKAFEPNMLISSNVENKKQLIFS